MGTTAVSAPALPNIAIGSSLAASRAAAQALQLPSQQPAIDVGPISPAGGEWPIDWTRARKDASQLVQSLDLTKPFIVIWVPGTSNHKVHPAFERAVRAAYGDSMALGLMDYEATWHLRGSVATGLATLLLVLEELKRRGISPDRIRLGGESQGAWIIGEAMAHPLLGKVAGRAVLLGHPWAAQHQYLAGNDPRVQVINHVGDLVTLPVKGDIGVGLDAMIAVRTLQLGRIGTVVKALLANPQHGVELLKTIPFAIPVLKDHLVNPHVYDPEMPDAVHFLREGVRVAPVRPPRKA